MIANEKEDEVILLLEFATLLYERELLIVTTIVTSK